MNAGFRNSHNSSNEVKEFGPSESTAKYTRPEAVMGF